MDPDVAWQELRAAMSAQDDEAAREWAANLLEWLDGGGFPPQALEPSDLDDETRRFAVRRTCLAVLHGTAGG